MERKFIIVKTSTTHHVTAVDQIRYIKPYEKSEAFKSIIFLLGQDELGLNSTETPEEIFKKLEL